MIRMSQTTKELKKKAKLLEPLVRIGREGLSPGQISEIMRQLRQKGLVKVKMLKVYYADKGRKQAGKEIASKTGSELVDVVGGIIVLSKETES
ncbi:RNA-binding protein [Candidatus Woesearchaeota archaeon]|nr:RNA-binding protein [Candidatus Woesearchaeota archaeon]